MAAQRAGSPGLERWTDTPRRNRSVLDTLMLTLYPSGCVTMSLHDSDSSSLLTENPYKATIRSAVQGSRWLYKVNVKESEDDS